MTEGEDMASSSIDSNVGPAYESHWCPTGLGGLLKPEGQPD